MSDPYKTHDYIHTNSGQSLSARVFIPETININDIVNDIANGLSKECRYARQSDEFFSVAQHSVLLSYIVEAKDALVTLFHDAAEAYLGDQAKPFKDELPDYQKLENRLLSHIFDKLGLVLPIPAYVKALDKRIMINETRAIFTTSTHPIALRTNPIPDLIINRAWGHREAKHRFLHRFNELIALQQKLDRGVR
jgi:hypothetical protein